MIDLRHVRHFLAVASHPTVQAAATATHITQPALTKSLARFEEELGAKLFDRRGHKLVLTELGEHLAQRGVELLRHVRELEEEVALYNGIGMGEVAIGVDPTAELSLLPPVLEAFTPAYLKVKVTVHTGHAHTLLPALLRGELHFLVADAELAMERDDLQIQSLAAEPLAAAVRPNHPLAQNPKPVAADLQAYPIAGASTAPRFARWSAEQARLEGVEPLGPGLICDNYEVLIRMVENTDTIVFGPRGLLSNYQDAGRVTVTTWPLNGPESNSSLIRSKGRHLSPAAEKLMSLFASTQSLPNPVST